MRKSEAVAQSILSWQSEYMQLETPDSFLENLVESFHEDDIPTKIKSIMIFENIGLDQVITLEEMKWTRSSIVKMVAIFVIGLAQLAAGIAIEILSQGTLTSLGAFLFSEGLGDMIFAVECAFRGHCTWKEYAKMKVISLSISFVFCGFGASFRPIARVSRSAITSKIAVRFHSKITKKAATDTLLSFMCETVEHHFSIKYIKKIFKTVRATVLEKVDNHGMNEKLAKLIRKIGPDETLIIVNRINKELIDAPWPHESFGTMQKITDKVGNLVTLLTDSVEESKRTWIGDSVTKKIRFASHLISWADKEIVFQKELAKLIEVFLNLMDSKLEEKLDRFKDQDEIFHGNDEFEKDIQQEWKDSLVKKIDDKFTNEVVIPLSKCFKNTLGKMCTQDLKAQYRETKFNRYRRIFDATVENSQDALNQPDADDKCAEDKYTTQHNVQAAEKMALQRNVEDLMYKTHDPDLMAAVCMYDTPLPILFATPLAVILGRPIVVSDLDGKILRRFSHYGPDNATRIEITYKKGHSKEPTAHFYSTEFENPRESKKNHDCFLRAVNVAVASDELITREELGDILKTDNHVRDLIVRKSHYGHFYFVDMGERIRQQLKKGELKRHLRNAQKKVIISLSFLQPFSCLVRRCSWTQCI